MRILAVAFAVLICCPVHGADRPPIAPPVDPGPVVPPIAPPVESAKSYVPPPCQQCNRGDVQCACPLNYGVCRCGELTKAQPVEVRRVPFVQPGSSSTPIISAMPAAGRSSSYPASTRMGLIRIGAPAAMYGGTNCGPSG